MNPTPQGLDLFRAAPHVRLHRGRIVVIKVGGGTVARPAGLERFARQVAVVEALGSRVVVVHGGGPQTDAVQRALGDEPRMVDGRRVTSPAALRALRMATAGELNGSVVAALIAAGVPAVGVTGASVVRADRRPPVPTSEGMVDFGEVGDVTSVDPTPLLALLESVSVPVLCPPAGDGRGGFLNVNADLVAAATATALGAEKLVLLTGAPGVLSDPADPGSLLSALSISELDELDANGALAAGMSVKAAAIRAALRGGVSRAHVVSGDDPDALLRELYTNQGSGTLVTAEPQRAPAAVHQEAIV
jgi:acetylglutamate kinase